MAVFLQSYGALLAIVFSWIMVAWVYVTKRAAWREKRFIRQVNFSLNVLDSDNQLHFRTLIETTAEDVWKSEIAVDTVLRAAEKTTEEQPFIVLDDASDMGYVLRAALNALSEKYSDAFIAKSLGKNIWTRKFVFGITCEKYGDTPTQKIRVMIVPETYLALFLHPDANNLWVNVSSHKPRLRTLQVMAKLYASKKREERQVLETIELGLP